MGTISDEIHHTASAISFSVYSSEELRKLSKVEIVTSIGTNELGHPLPGGLYDLRMGPYMRDFGVCATCHLSFLHCPGHLGHIELALPVINPLFRSVVVNLLSRTCLKCSALLYPGPLLTLTGVQLELLDLGLAAEALGAADLVPREARRTAGERTRRGGDADLEPDLEDTLTSASSQTVTAKLRAYLSDAKQRLADGKVVSQVRNVILEQRAVIKNFLGYKPCRQCPSCTFRQPSITDFQGHIVRVNSAASGKKAAEMLENADPRSYVTVSEARTVLRKLWQREQELLCRVFGMLKSLQNSEHPTDSFFMEVLPVTAPRLRPLERARGRPVEPVQSHVYGLLLEVSRLLRQLVAARRSGLTSLEQAPPDQRRAFASVKGDTMDNKILHCWENLQGLVDLVVDADMNKSAARRVSVKNLRGVKQVLEKKEGIFRMNMMGKRVDFAGRTVITPDPYLSVEELGVPEVMAMKLTYPEPVTPQNLAQLQQAVRNGPSKFPGANMIQFPSGAKVILREDARQRHAVAASLLTPSYDQNRKHEGPKIIHRHLVTGDTVLLNRQPTLHRPSIMAQRVRVLPGEKTFRLHYSNCKSYNADFDGDEMNMHLPQGEEARSEAVSLLYSPHNYLVPKDGTPLGGLIQDHVVAGVRLSMRGTWFARDQYQQLVASALGDHRRRVQLLPPALLRPRQLWTGKQVLSTVIINLTPPGRPAINVLSKAKLGAKVWQRRRPRPWTAGGAIRELELSEAEVVIRGGHLLCGVLDKQQFGAVPFSLVHGFFELYGGAASSRLLSAFSRLFTCYLHTLGFTLGVRDILVTSAADARRRHVIAQSVELGTAAAADALGLASPEERSHPELVRGLLEQQHLAGSARTTRDLDRAYKQQLDAVNNDINKVCLAQGLVESFPDNNLQLMVESGAKGSKVNTMQISCLLGQIELEGKRPPRMVSGKTLPSFAPYDLTPRAGGFIASRFMTGIRPQEYFFHCMAGREGLIDTAVKTSRSGYLQRCLIKHLEGLVVGYDSTVRDSDGSVIQFRYGEDGFETQKVPYLTEKQLPFLEDNHRGMYDLDTVEDFKQRSQIHAIKKLKKKIRKWKRTFGDPRAHRRCGPFLDFTRDNLVDPKPGYKASRPKTYHQHLENWQNLDLEARKKLYQGCRRCPDPADSRYAPAAHFSSVCEQLDGLITDYLASRPDRSPQLEEMLYMKVARAVVAPGEAVGLVAAQSIGEPSTQMTLNTFHFAGLGDMNVTLGIPRLREILSASRSMKTPSMEIPVRGEPAAATRAAHKLRLRLARVTLAQVLREVAVSDRCIKGQTRVYRLRLRFLPRSAYRAEFALTPAAVLQYVETVWVRLLLKLLAKTFKFKDVNSSLGKDAAAAAAEASGERDDDAAAAPAEDADAPPEPEAEPAAGDGDDSDGEGDGDATDARTRARRDDEADYDSEEEEEADPDPEVDAEQEDDEAMPVKKAGASADTRRQMVQALRVDNCQVTKYEFDEKCQHWCQITITVSTARQCDLQTLVTDAAHAGVIRQVPGISRVFVLEDGEKGTRLCTEGINLTYMTRFGDLLDLNRMYCNDLHSMASYYGIEAAASAIVKEISAVFGVYGIAVGRRHLSLVADYMTCSGVVRGFNRGAMDAVVSPLQQMSFETTVQFLRKAVLTGQVDELKSPSAKLVMGQPYGAGTGMFSLLQKIADLRL